MTDNEMREPKGQRYEGPCNVTACQKPGATFWNTSTLAWYCPKCAKGINEGAGTNVHGVRLCVGPDSLPYSALQSRKQVSAMSEDELGEIDMALHALSEGNFYFDYDRAHEWARLFNKMRALIVAGFCKSACNPPVTCVTLDDYNIILRERDYHLAMEQGLQDGERLDAARIAKLEVALRDALTEIHEAEDKFHVFWCNAPRGHPDEPFMLKLRDQMTSAVKRITAALNDTQKGGGHE